MNANNDETKAAGSAKSGRMQRTINALIQTQDLIFARDQQEASMPGARLATLDASIESMLGCLPPEVGSHFGKMHKKGTLAIVPIANGVCSACGMMIPVSQVHAVHAADDIYRCPSCARFLYYPESPLRRASAKKKRRGEPPQLGIARFSSPGLMLPLVDCTERDDLLTLVARKIHEEGFVEDPERLAEEALRREAIANTAVDHGVAFPHVRGVEGGGLTLALATSKKGIRFDASSKNLTRIVFFIVIPTAASAFYLKLLSGLSQTFSKEENREALLKADKQDELWKVLTKMTRTTIA